MVGKLTTRTIARRDNGYSGLAVAAAEDFLFEWESAQCHIPLTVFGTVLLEGRKEGPAHALFVTMFDYDPRAFQRPARHLTLTAGVTFLTGVGNSSVSQSTVHPITWFFGRRSFNGRSSFGVPASLPSSAALLANSQPWPSY